MLAILRRKIGDVEEPYVFSDVDLLSELAEAVKRYNSKFTVYTVPENDQPLVIKTAWIQICYLLAADRAKYDRISISGMDIDKTVSFSNYLQLAQFLENQLKEDFDVLDVDSPRAGINTIIEGTLTREIPYNEHTVPYEAAQKPPARKLELEVAGLLVHLKWDVWYSTEFLSYTLYRSKITNDIGEQILTVYNNHTEKYIDTVDAGTYYYTLRVRTKNLLYTDSEKVQANVA